MNKINPEHTLYVTEGTVHCELGGIKLSFLFYKQPLIYSTIIWHEIKVTDWRDIVAEKFKAISQRGSKKACIIAGLDPYVGFVHTDNYNKKSLVFDLIEMFRIFADQTVVYLFSQRQIKQEYFDKIKNGLTLNKAGKAVLIEALNKTFDKSVRYKGRNIKNKNIIQFECHAIANGIIRENR